MFSGIQSLRTYAQIVGMSKTSKVGGAQTQGKWESKQCTHLFSK